MKRVNPTQLYITNSHSKPGKPYFCSQVLLLLELETPSIVQMAFGRKDQAEYVYSI